jgi:type IV secretory pathway TraG/TraD family ATPase VirD4
MPNPSKLAQITNSLLSPLKSQGEEFGGANTSGSTSKLREGKRILWGNVGVRVKDANTHFMVVGATGSGKTTFINRILWSLFEFRDSGLSKKFRALIYDPKQDMVPYVYGMSERQEQDKQKGNLDPARIRILHPFDTRSYAWDIAKDIDDPISARQVATILVPESSGKSAAEGDAFFDNAVRDLLTGVILSFINCSDAGKWTFRDVILAMLYEDYLRLVLERNTLDGEVFHIGRRLLKCYLDGEPRTVSNIKASILARLSIYEPLAAVWHKAYEDKKCFSIAEWITSDQILILGNDESSRSSLDKINQVLFKRITELLLSKESPPDTSDGEDFSWIFLDEVREAGHLDGLSRLLTKGRSKGVCIVLGFQDIDGLRSVYGTEIANEITGQCHNIAILHTNSATTAQWGADIFGRFLSTDVARTVGAESGEGSRNISRQERMKVYSGDIIELPKASSVNGLHCYLRAEQKEKLKDAKQHLKWEEQVAEFLIQKSTKQEHVGFSPRPKKEQYLKIWDENDLQRLNINLPSNPPKASLQNFKK